MQVAICCALKRGDAVCQLFNSLITSKDSGSSEDTADLYARIRESMTVIWPFVGIPAVVPAGLGLAHVLQYHGIDPETRMR